VELLRRCIVELALYVDDYRGLHGKSPILSPPGFRFVRCPAGEEPVNNLHAFVREVDEALVHLGW
jgi:hypothetical protein